MDIVCAVIAAGLAVLCLPYLIVAFAYLVGIRARLLVEAGLPTTSGTEGAGYPAVLLQIPCFNEERFVEQAVLAVARLVWPADRLRVQILDDSTDDTTRLAERAVEAVRRSGIDVSVIHREARRGYKAGALHDGLTDATEPFVAILDVDYQPPPDWLDRAVGALTADGGRAYVQSRIGFANRFESWVTKAQAALLDGQNVVEQTGRALCGILVPFGGTGGVWRREAIDRAGGWVTHTVAEDMDLSYRAVEEGWSSLYLTSHSVEGHLPATVRAWQTQQLRWSTGGMQVALAALRRLLATSPRRWSFAVIGSLLLHLADAVYAPLVLIALIVAIGRAAAGIFGPVEIVLAVLVYIAGSMRIFWFPLLATRVSLGRVRIGYAFQGLAGAIYLGVRLALVKVVGATVALTGGGRHFERTPK
jgi:cellulose synthase/poly-beta-1,6-N-acetylglucosamine synthase-like glycosyltransferase